MKKSHAFNVLSDQVCAVHGCRRKLKLRRVQEHSDTLCYRCQQKKRKASGRSFRNLKKAYAHA